MCNKERAMGGDAAGGGGDSKFSGDAERDVGGGEGGGMSRLGKDWASVAGDPGKDSKFSGDVERDVGGICWSSSVRA